jgi:hypothetical protein
MMRHHTKGCSSLTCMFEQDIRVLSWNAEIVHMTDLWCWNYGCMGKIILYFIFGMRVKASCIVCSDVFINCIITKLGEIKIILVFYSLTILLFQELWQHILKFIYYQLFVWVYRNTALIDLWFWLMHVNFHRIPYCCSLVNRKTFEIDLFQSR